MTTAPSPEAVARVQSVSQRLMANVEKVIVGKTAEVQLTLVGLLCQGHLLIEDVPGVGKTTLAKAIARSVGTSFNRIQFTPDMLPSDVTGVSIFNQQTRDFEFRPGPIMAQIVLADEINRATPKTQAALLEAMEEKQITVDGATHHLPAPFMVLATQNPIEYEGTFPLPEAQLDRFLLKAVVGYPSRLDERVILDRGLSGEEIVVRAAADAEAILFARRATRTVHIDDRLKDYIIQLVRATREPAAAGLGALSGLLSYGASPRATVFLGQTAQAHAFLEGRHYVIPEDIKAVAPDVLRHRIVITYEAEAEDLTADDIVGRVLAAVPVP